ncbi:MAG TPA: dockerin type I domain-containing protein [candidate division Zixibacteria bacterium]|nr:dockerin type I domain-containing protein [candidate division Zixibacteria bacterium]
MFVTDTYYTTNSISGAWCYKALAPVKAAYMRTYIKFNSMPTVDSEFQNWGPSLANDSASGYLAYCGLMKNASGTYWGVQMQLSGGGSSYFYESIPSNATANTWYSVEVYDNVDPVNGVISMWVDDVVKLNFTGLNTAQIDTYIRYCKVIGVGTSPVSLYADDVVVSTAYVGSPMRFRDINIKSVTSSKTVCGSGFMAGVTVEVSNLGNDSETFNVTALFIKLEGPDRSASALDWTAINETVNNLTAGSAVNLTITWNTTGVPYGNYNTSAYAWPVPNKKDLGNISLTGHNVTVTIPGDINGDYKVTLSDLVLLANAYGSTPSSAKWSPNADINGNGDVDLADLVTLALHYGQHDP